MTDQGLGIEPSPSVFPHHWIPSAKGARFYVASVRIAYLFIIPSPDGEPLSGSAQEHPLTVRANQGGRCPRLSHLRQNGEGVRIYHWQQ